MPVSEPTPLRESPSDWPRIILDRISAARKSLAELEDFFRQTDQEIADNEDDPREGLGRLMGLDRLILLLPYIFNRLTEDITHKHIAPSHSPQVIESLEAIKQAIQGVLTWYLRDDINQALSLTDNALTKIRQHSDKIITVDAGRFWRDLARFAPDLEIIRGMLDDFRECRRIRPKHPEPEESWSAQRWLDYYREQARLEEPIIAVIDAEGLSQANLAKGMRLMEEQNQRLDRIKDEFIRRYNLIRDRDLAFDPAQPERFLELAEIPEAEDDDSDAKVHAIDLCYEEEEPPSPWAGSLPELALWDKTKAAFTDTGDRDAPHPEFLDDPVYQLLDPFVHKLVSSLKEAYLEQRRRSGEKAYPPRSALENYLVLLAYKPQVRIASSHVWVDEAGHEGPRHGVYLFAAECLEKIANAIEKLGPPDLHHLAQEARHVRQDINDYIKP